MATIYKVEIVSHWGNYTIEDMQKIIEEALKKEEWNMGNSISVDVIEKR